MFAELLKMTIYVCQIWQNLPDRLLLKIIVKNWNIQQGNNDRSHCNGNIELRAHLFKTQEKFVCFQRVKHFS